MSDLMPGNINARKIAGVELEADIAETGNDAEGIARARYDLSSSVHLER